MRASPSPCARVRAWADKYVLDRDQGGAVEGFKEGGTPVILFLDGHASRWSRSALTFFMAHNIHVICVPSHTTIWSQPNDAGANASFKAFLGVCCTPFPCAPCARRDRPRNCVAAAALRLHRPLLTALATTFLLALSR